jgi:hypothetical protein
MKKLMMMTLLLMMMAVTANAKSAVAVKSGDVNVFVQSGKTATLKLDFSKAKIANLSKNELTDKLMRTHLEETDPVTAENWESKHVPECRAFFIERWNEGKNCLKMVDGTSGDYQVIVNIDYIDFGSGSAAVWGFGKKAGGAIIRGTLDVKDASGKTICTLDINDLRGMSQRTMDMKFPTFGRRMALLFKTVAKEVLDFVKAETK